MGYSFKFQSSKVRAFEGGELLRASKANFPALKCLAIQALNLRKGVTREPHVHPNAHQLDYCLSGRARVGIVSPGGKRQLLTLEEGDISFVPQGYLHWIENIGSGQLRFLVMLSNEEPETLELSEMLSRVPPDTLGSVFGFSKSVLKALPKKAITIGGAL
jgi:oxalate decarboxylase/phosphoglucose isomerase-like protein (cupin superfamily)